MEDHMYTYQYYKRRSLSQPTRTPNILMTTILLFGAIYTATSIMYLFQ